MDLRDWLRELLRPVAAGWGQVSIPMGFPLSLATAGHLLSPEQPNPNGQLGGAHADTFPGTSSLLVTMGPLSKAPASSPFSLPGYRTP